MAQETIKHGVNLEQYPKFIESATGNPESIRLGLGARGVAEGRAMHTLAKVDAFSLGGDEIRRETREYTFPMGAHKELETEAGFVDPADRPEPVELVLAALTGCVNATLGIVAMEGDIDLDGLETNVNVDLDPQVFFGIRDADGSDGTYSDIGIDVEVSGPELTERDAEVLRRGMERSPVFDLLAMSQEMSPEVNLTDVPKAA